MGLVSHVLAQCMTGVKYDGAYALCYDKLYAISVKHSRIAYGTYIISGTIPHRLS